MGRRIALQEGSVSYSTTGLEAQFSNRGPISMIQEVGLMMMRGNVRTYLTGDAATTNRMAQLEMGCLNKGFKIACEFETEERPRSCNTTGNVILHKSGKWTGALETSQLDPVLMAMWTGATIRNPSASTPLTIITTETLTAVASVVTLTGTPTFPSKFPIVSVKRTSDDELYYEGDAALAPTGGAPGTYILDTTAGTLTFAAGDATSEFEIVYRETSTTWTDGLVLTNSLAHFPSTFDGWLSFLAIDKSTNSTGRIIAELSKAYITSPFELGGQGVRENLSKSIEFTLEEAPTFYWEEFAA